METLVEEFEHEGLRCEIHWEPYGEEFDPRQWENFGTMVCWHPEYILGDFQVTNPDGRGAVKNRFHRDNFESMEVLERYLTLVERAVCVLPLSLYDHSGVTMFVGHRHPFDSAGWDTTTVGFIYATPDDMVKAGIELDDVEKILRQEVDIYDDWLRGEIFCWMVLDENGDILDACGGYVGDIDLVREEAKENAEWQRKDKLINQEPNYPEGLRT